MHLSPRRCPAAYLSCMEPPGQTCVQKIESTKRNYVGDTYAGVKKNIGLKCLGKSINIYVVYIRKMLHNCCFFTNEVFNWEK